MCVGRPPTQATPGGSAPKAAASWAGVERVAARGHPKSVGASNCDELLWQSAEEWRVGYRLGTVGGGSSGGWRQIGGAVRSRELVCFSGFS